MKSSGSQRNIYAGPLNHWKDLGFYSGWGRKAWIFINRGSV